MCYVDLTRDELLPLYMQNSNGLTIITNGGSQFYYGRKGQEIRSFDPFKVQVVRLKTFPIPDGWEGFTASNTL